MSTEHIAQNIETVLARLSDAATVGGRNPEDIQLIAVSKTVSAVAVQAAFDAGHRDFGENRVQELQAKRSALPRACCWHMIGHLQKNKVRPAVQCADWIHSVDSRKLLQRIDRIAGEDGRHPRILLEVNVTGEASKFGLAPDETEPLLLHAHECSHLDCAGLMTMAPFAAEEAELHRIFARLRELRNTLSDRTGVALPELSMGMSADFEVAIEEGATMVRIGTAIFGARH